ncbi:CRISPR system precrRNA processing endoribonuclease RAMP protein Cas6 [Sulfurimonas sp. NW15]|uniref:CRISPR system precrRNA processing endoribonuclease RAMP protein Cas6 n=1 Tax=Sulfurimonas sp. NW15 TaxID=2922729 RepID=UPI003DA85FBC
MIFTKLSIIINAKPPYFIGSQLRGAFGYALKKVVCINPSFTCDGCFAKDSCLYYDFYEKKNSFHSYRFDFELGLNYYDFNLYLFEDAVSKLPYVISAFIKLLGEVGLGRDRLKFSNFDIFVNNTLINKNGTIQLPQNYTKTFTIENYYQDVLIKFITPLRIKKNNRFLRDDNIELKDIINSIYQRQMKLLGKDYRKFPYKMKGKIVKKGLNYKQLTRRSNRQKTTMNLDGLIGEIAIEGLTKEEYNILRIGELVGVGKSTVFGLGKIEIKESK